MSGQYVIIKVGNLYMQHNRAKDYSAGTWAVPDMLAFIRNDGTGTTMLMAGLNLADLT